METKKSEGANRCKVCKQYMADINFFEEIKNENALTEENALSGDQFCIKVGHGEIENKEVPYVKLTSFMIYDKYNHLCPFDTGLLEKGVDLFFSGYIKPVDTEDSSINNGILIQNAGPLKEWWIYGFDGGKKSLIGLTTDRALYYLMEPSSLYENIFQNTHLKNKLSKIVIEFLLDFGYQNPTFEDFIQHLKNFDFPEVEELLFREAEFLCNQIVNYDGEPSEEVPMTSFSCIQTLIKLTGISLTKEKSHIKVKGTKKQDISFPKAVSTKLVRDVFEKCFYEEVSNETLNGQGMKSYEKQGSTEDNINKCKDVKNSSPCAKSEQADCQSELRNKPIKHKECSKLIVHNVKWLKKSPVKYIGNQGYSLAAVDNFVIQQGDYVMLQAEQPNESLRIARVCYMYDSPTDGAIFHAHFFCRGTDTILGHVANPRELFIVDDCDDCPVGCIIKKTEVEFVRNSENWADLGDKVKLPLESADNGTKYYYSKIYDYEFSKFRDYIEDTAVDGEYLCFSCKWQKNIKTNETPVYKDNYIIWRANEYKIGTAVFLEPGQNKCINKPILNEEESPINDKLHPELYRKKLDLNRGSNLDTPEPFTIGLIEEMRKQKNDVKIKVRMFYRPEDTSQSHFLAYVSDINYLFWTNNVIWTTFKYVAGKCYLTYAEDKHLAKKWSGEGPFRFYYSEAYDYKDFNIYDVPSSGRKVCCDFLMKKEPVRITRSTFKSLDIKSIQNNTDSSPLWQQINQPLKCMDIYAGCGGLSEGLHQSGVAKTLWAIEKETAPAQAYQMNNPSCHVIIDDCNNVLEALLDGKAKNFNYPDKGDVDLLVGGPPCQGFSGMNRFSSGQDSHLNNSQITTYLSYCDFYRPKYIIFENVRNFVSFKKSLVFKLTLKCLLAMGYQISFGILQAGHFGIPQTRRRFILMGAAPGYTLPSLPDPLHVFSRSGTYLSIIVDGLRYDTGTFWSESLPYRTICVRDAIADLPDIKNGATETDVPYDEEAHSHFQKYMRKNNKIKMVKDHICKEMSVIAEERIAHIPTYPGADWRDLPNIEVQLKNGFVAKVLKYPYRKKNQSKLDPPRGVCKCVLGKQCDPSDRQSNTLIPWFLVHTADRHSNWVAVYGRLEWDGFFGTTITNPEPTGTQGRVLHPDQNRVVSVRECARSQGFPDDYKFSGNILDKHRQVGNAVPPTLALALGREIIKAHNTSIKEV